MHQLRTLILGALVCLSGPILGGNQAFADPKQYDVTWDSPSADHDGTMPLGNGDIAVNAWIEASGDLIFYIAKSDAWEDNGRLAKVGKVRIGLDAGRDTASFSQTLRLRDATLAAVYGEGDARTTLRVWVDANHPVTSLLIYWSGGRRR
jgi:alpha-L-fucosidase 2